MSTLPNEAECIDILHMAGAPDRVIKHICTVAVLAQAIARRCGADVKLVMAGAMLHDIGRGRTHGIRHAVEGVAIARSLGLPEPVVLIIQKHTWAGMDPEEAVEVGLPLLDYMPSTLEEKIVCHADNLVGDATYTTSAEAYQEFVRKGFLSTAERFMDMHRELSARCGEDIDHIVRRVSSTKHHGPCSRYLDMKIDKWMD